MGKVGSATIKNSLENLGLANPIYHVHFLSWEGLKEAEDYCVSRSNGNVPEHIIIGKRLRYQIDRDNGIRRWKIITLAREPVAREISNIFENMELILPNSNNTHANNKFSEIYDYLIERFDNFDESSNYVCNWFDKEIKSVFGIDIYRGAACP